MAGRSHTNWPLYLTLLRMGVPPSDAVGLVGVQLSTPYARMSRHPAFKAQVEEAMAEGQRSLVASPSNFSLNGELLLDSNFEPIRRQPPQGLKPWVLSQLRRNPLTAMAL